MALVHNTFYFVSNKELTYVEFLLDSYIEIDLAGAIEEIDARFQIDASWQKPERSTQHSVG
jgi:hypothetical protein